MITAAQPQGRYQHYDLASAASPELLVAELRSWKETAAAVAAEYGDVKLEWLD